MIEFYKNSVASANLISPEYFVEISRQALMFDDVFKLGSTPCMSYNVSMAKDSIGEFEKIIVVEDGVQKHVLYLDDLDTSNDLYDEYVLTDSMIKFNATYDGSTLTNHGQTAVTYMAILQDICSQFGVGCGVTSFIGSTKTTSTYDNTVPAREYISWLAEMNGGYAVINENDELVFKQFSSSVATISALLCSSFKVGSLHKIQRVVFDNYDVKYEQGTVTDGETLYINIENRFITAQGDVEAIYNVINGFSFYNIKVDKCPVAEASVGDVITFNLYEDNYPTIVQIDQSYVLGWIGGYECEVANAEQIETQIMGTERRMRTMIVKYDAELNEFSRTLAETNDRIDSGVKSIKPQYALSTSKTEVLVALTYVSQSTIIGKGTFVRSETREIEWLDEMPEVPGGYYLWARDLVTWLDDSTSYENLRCLEGISVNTQLIYYKESQLIQRADEILGRVEDENIYNQRRWAELSLKADEINQKVVDETQNLWTQVNQNSSDIASTVGRIDEQGNYIELAKTMLDEDGFHVETAGTDRSSTLNGDGLTVTDSSGNEVLVASGTDKGVIASNLTANNYLILNYGTFIARFEPYSDIYDNEQIGIYVD